MQDIVQAIGKTTWFGQCDIKDLQSVETERRDRDKMIQLEREKRWEENKLAEDERRRQEEEDYQFALKEQERYDALNSSPSKTCGRGRGATMARLLNIPELPKPAQGRGRFARESKNKDSSFRRDVLLTDQITKTNGGEEIYRNSHQEKIWSGGYTVNYTLQDSRLNIQDFTPACDGDASKPSVSDYNDNVPTCADNELDQGACAPAPKLTADYDQYEDAGSSSSSFLSVKQDTPSFESASSSVSASPVEQQDPVPLQRGQMTMTPRKPHLAANFSNPMITSPSPTEQSNVSHYDFFAEFSTHKKKTPSRHSGTSFNSITAAQRVIGRGEVAPVDLFNNQQLYCGNSGDFHLNQAEFPPLQPQ